MSGTTFTVLLTSNNHHTWNTKMEDFLCCQRLAPLILHEGQRLEGKKADAWAITDRMCLGVIRRFVDDSVHHHIPEETYAYDAYVILKETYENPSPMNKVLAIRKFVYMKYTDGTPMATHLNEIKYIINLPNQMTIGLSDEVHSLLILVTLPESWLAVSITLSNSYTNGKLTVKFLTAALLYEEVRRKNAGMTSSTAETIATAEWGRQERKHGIEG